MNLGSNISCPIVMVGFRECVMHMLIYASTYANKSITLVIYEISTPIVSGLSKILLFFSMASSQE